MGITTTEWKKIGGWTAVSIFIGGSFLAYYGGREVFRFYNKKQLEKGKIKILEDVKTSNKNASVSDEDVELLSHSWQENLDKLSIPALEAFVNYYNAVIDSETTELIAKKKENLNKFITVETINDVPVQLFDNTKILEQFDAFQKLKIDGKV